MARKAGSFTSPPKLSPADSKQITCAGASALPSLPGAMVSDGALRKADPYTDGALRKADPYTDGALAGKRDPFTDGAYSATGKRDVFSDGA